ncbi:hypothetical protein LV84_02040 [Algoriphagus ratkowskyi]|uniref:Uncharacterized protein n=1 Tax=Algoriphagus ratkowskyi TaxID=57028 RepID=A0A2W7RA19_9BACT|nr:hypothetical protein [Algoriphagus ratkowskyi]PZX56911.1 hypothetical protein LV84_02040 [Algoriphagus ratkowskyi]TXD79824.1 hypothetical protein ESW18_01450 [Algoriphagus ratkowskyi]
MRKMDVVGLQSEFFKKYGFALIHSHLLFEKVFPHGKQVIFVHFTEGLKDINIEYHLAIRINAVEELVQKFLPSPLSYAEQSITIAQTPDKLGNIYPKKITVSDEIDLSKIINDVEEFFLNTGFAWLDQMIDPKYLEQEFLRQSENLMHDCNLVESAFRSTAVSKLYNGQDYPILRQAFLETIHSQEFTPFTIASFLQFLDYLDKLDQVAA